MNTFSIVIGRLYYRIALILTGGLLPLGISSAQLAVKAETLHTMAGDAIREGVVLMDGGKITHVGRAGEIRIPEDYKTLTAKVVIPGIIDAHTTVGLSGILNYHHDQEQLEKSEPIQPELRAIDAYNPRDPLVAWLRQFGITTINTGHSPGALVSGQAMIIKTNRENVADGPTRPLSMVMAALGTGSLAEETGKSPGTRAKAVALLRSQLVKAQVYAGKLVVRSTKLSTQDLEIESFPSMHDGLLVDLQNALENSLLQFKFGLHSNAS